MPFARVAGPPAVVLPVPLAGSYFYVNSPNATSTSAALTVGQLRMTPWVVPQALRLDRLGAEVTAAGDVGSRFRVGIYADNGTGHPGALVIDAGQIAGDAVGLQFATIDVTLPAGLYWVGGAVQVVTTTQPTIRTATAPVAAPVMIPLGTGVPGANGMALGVGQAGVTDVFPAAVTVPAAPSGVMPRFICRAA